MSRRLSGLGIALLFTLTGLRPLPSGAATRERAPSPDPARQIEKLLSRLGRYRDGLERSARPISLQEALRMGLSANPTLRQSWEAVRQADWSVVAIQREWWPSLIAGSDDPGILGWTTTTTRERIRGPQGNSRSVTVSGGQSSLPNLTLSWTFLDPSRRSRGNAARSEQVARRFLFDVDARDLILRIQSAYVLLQEQAELERNYRGLYDNLTALFSAKPVITRTATYIYACSEWVDDAFQGKELMLEVYSRLLNPTSVSLANNVSVCSVTQTNVCDG